MPKHVTPEETFHCLRQWSIIDVRNHERYKQNHIEGARWMSAANALKIASEKFEKNEKFLLYDEGDEDQTAESVATLLESNGFSGISILDGGYRAWSKQRYPNRSVNEPAPSPRRIL